MAPPTMPIMSNAAPIFVNFPRLFIANGQMEGHINALEKPSNAKQKTAVSPDVNIDASTSIILKIVLATNAFCCEIYLGIQMIPTT